ncbi:MAG: T9SS type A sorting domain-containing protein [Bacteroidota bacterium]
MMKKLIVLGLWNWIVLSGGLTAQTIHQFQFKNGQYLTAKGGALYVSQQQKGSEEVTQWFIATLQDDFSFKIAPLSSPESYLTFDNGNLTFSTSESTGTDWKALYAGGSFVSISGTDANLVLADMGGQARLIEPATRLKSNDDPAGDHYRLTVLTGAPSVASSQTVASQRLQNAERPGLDRVKTYPNPIKEEASIVYRVSNTDHVAISIMDLKGRLINVLVDAVQESGTYEVEWNRANKSGVKVPSGLYVLAFRAGDSTYNQLLIVK